MTANTYLDSSSVCMQHSIMTTSVLATFMTTIAVVTGAFKWFHWLPLPTAVLTSLVAVPAAYTLNLKLLVVFAICDGLDFLFKVFTIGSFIYYKVKITEDCSPFDLAGEEEKCPDGNWRLLTLDLTNAIVYHVFATIVELILFTFAIYLIYTVKKYPIHFDEFSFEGSFSTATSDSKKSFA